MDLRPHLWIARAPAKLNLFLEVAERRHDGFHDLETLMVPIRLSDSLSVEPTRPTARGTPGEISLHIDYTLTPDSSPIPQSIPSDEKNLVARALQLLRTRSGCEYGAQVRLAKRIPVGAGLGGGSSDAAAAIRLANRAWQINWPAKRLAEVAAEVGSDVPFFLAPGAAICRGRGEHVEPIGPLTRIHFVIVKPPIALKTTDVYRAHDQLQPPEATHRAPCISGIMDALHRGHWCAPGLALHNSLQVAAALLSPWVDRLRRTFNNLDCLAHQLSGSGSAYFGVCRHAHHARRLATMLRTRQLGLVYATCSYP